MATRLPTVSTARRTWAAPARLWGALGVVFLAVQAVLFGRWILADGLHVTFDSDADISPVRATIVWIVQALVIAASVVVVYVLARQCIREGSISFDTAIAVGFVLCAWQDPLLEWVKPTFFHSYYALHFTPNWGPHLPGWSHPGLTRPITLALAPSGLGYLAMITCVWLQCRLAGRVLRLHEQWRTGRILATYLAAGLVVVVSFEAVFIGAGIYTYPLAVPALSLWAGHWYQYPLTEMVTWTLFLTAFAFMRHRLVANGVIPHIFRYAETSINRWWARLLTGVGITNTLMLTYVIINVSSTYFGGPIPADTPSYLWPR